MINAARIPGTLLAATQAPTPLPQMARPRGDLANCHRPGQGRHNIRVVISRIQRVGSEVRHFITGGLKRCGQLHFQLKATMVCSYADKHHFSTFINMGLCQLPSAAMSASACFGPQLPGLYGWTG